PLPLAESVEVTVDSGAAGGGAAKGAAFGGAEPAGVEPGAPHWLSHGGGSYLHDPCGCSPFVWPLAVWYAAHQLNLWPHVSLPETSHALRWAGKVGDASVFRVWGSHAFVRDTSTDKLSSRAIPCVFLGFPPDALGWQFYHPTSHPFLPSQDVTFDESVPFYRLFPYRATPLPPPAALPRYRSPSDRPPPPSGSCSLSCVSGRPTPLG
ncbi:unnamed protein product, partial [Closterium sp. NIES-53]